MDQKLVSISKHLFYKICFVIIGLLVIAIAKIGLIPSYCILLIATGFNLLIIWQVRKLQPLLIITIFMLTYLGYLYPYYFKDTVMGFHTKYYRPDLFDTVLSIHAVFLATIILFLRNIKSDGMILVREYLPKKNNPVVFYCLFGVLSLILITSKGENILNGDSDSYQSYMENLSKQGGSWEYIYLVFLLTYIYSKNNFNKLLLVIVFIIYSYLSITRGYRIQLIQMLFLFFTLFLDGKFKTRYIVFTSFVGLIGIEVYGILKEIGGRLSIDEIWQWIDSKNGVMLTNQTEVFYSSAAIIGSTRDGILGFSNRLLSTAGFLENTFIPSTYVIRQGRVPEFVSSFTDLGGGSYVSAYFYVWFGLLGVIIIGWLIASAFNTIGKINVNNGIKLMVVIVIVVTPRWFAYDPANFLFRLPIYMYIFYRLSVLMDVETKRYIKINRN